MHNRVTGLLPPARNPGITGIGQLIEPLKAKVAQIGQNEGSWRDILEHGSRMLLAILAGLGHILDGSPLLQAHIEEGHQLAWQQDGIPFARGTQQG